MFWRRRPADRPSVAGRRVAAPHPGNTPQEPDVLELRVHGVANTPPAAMLDLRPDQVEQVDGDALGSFWTPTAQAAAVPRRPTDARVVPDGVRREAYSWGAMARLSRLPVVGQASGLVAGVVRALWVLIVPFGLANVAYWARDADEPHGRRSSAAGGLVRLFGLGLTLLWVTTVATVTLGVVGAQCYGPRTDVPGAGDGTQYVQVCAALPGWTDVAARWTTGSRTAVLVLVTAALVVVLGAVGSTGRLRYERRMSTTKARGLAEGSAPDRPDDGVWPLLARPGFWTHARRSSVQWFQHLAAAFALLAALVAWHFLYRDVPGCTGSSGFGAHGCFSPDVWGTDGRLPWALMVAAGVVVLAVAAWRTGRLRLDPLPPRRGVEVPENRVGRASEVTLLVAALAVLGWVALAVARSGDEPLLPADAESGTGRVAFLGLHALPRLVVAALVLLVIAAVGARGRLRAAWWVPLVCVCLVASGVAVAWPDGGTSVVSRAVAGAALVVLVAVAWRAQRRRVARVHEGWSGRGPAVLLTVAAGTAMVLSAAAVLGTVAWLDRPAAAENQRLDAAVTKSLTELAAADPLRDPVVVHVPAPAELDVPPGYEQFAVASVAVVALLVLLVVVLTVRMGALRRTPVPDTPGAPASPPANGEQQAVQTGRHHAALAHRAERFVGALAVLFFVALVATLVLPDPRSTYPGAWGAIWSAGVDLSGSAVVAAFALIVASVVLAGSKQALARPWGLLWDLMCFLPRAAHPFAPPCYAERVVPELRARIDAWLGDDGTPLPVGVGARRRVVVSAHSLGGVVAVATLFARWDGPAGSRDHRVALLTYGTQLRAYFGRFFPELFGPAVLGTRPSAGSRLWAADPWSTDPPGAVAPPAATLLGSLSTGAPATVRWRSLWRRTDFIGFPVDSYATGPVDTPASEIDPDAYLLAVAAHSGYPRAPEYRTELDTLVARLRASRPARRA